MGSQHIGQVPSTVSEGVIVVVEQRLAIRDFAERRHMGEDSTGASPRGHLGGGVGVIGRGENVLLVPAIGCAGLVDIEGEGGRLAPGRLAALNVIHVNFQWITWSPITMA